MSKKIAVECPTCKETRYLRPSDAKRARQCRRCHLRQIAPLGFKALIEKYGEKAAVKFLQEYRLDNPSNLERAVAQLLTGMGVEFEREVWYERDGKVYLLDFSVDGRVIEVNGSYAHSHHEERDAHKLSVLTANGFSVLILSDTERNLWYEQIWEFLHTS